MADYKTPVNKKGAEAVKKDEDKSFALEAYQLFKRGFDIRNIDIAPFCGRESKYISRIVSVKAGGSLAGPDGIRFADGVLYVGRKVYDKYNKNPVVFADVCAAAVLKGLQEQANWKKGYKVGEQDYKYLTSLHFKLLSGLPNLMAIPSAAKSASGPKEEAMVKLEGPVYVTESMHKLYQSMKQPKGHFVTEQAFAAGYTEYLRAVKLGDIKAGEYILNDLNLHMSHRRSYLMDFSDANHPVIVDSGRVEHGIGNDPDRDGWVDTMSDVNDSHASSQGLYVIVKAESSAKFGGVFYRMEGKASSSFRAMQRGILIHEECDGYSWGCQGRNPNNAREWGMPLDGNMPELSARELKKKTDRWIGVGVFNYYEPTVQKVCKKYWPVEKKK